jgi:hypothetical protein
MNKDKIIEYVYKSETIRRALNNINLPITIEKDDMLSHLILELLEMDSNKLFKSYEEGYLDRLCVTIMVNSKSKTGRLWKQYNQNVSNDFVDLNKQNEELISDKLIPYLNEALIAYEQKDNFLEANFNKTLINLYYYKNLNYRQIEELTGIKSSKIRKSIIKTKLWLKQYINNKIKYE